MPTLPTFSCHRVQLDAPPFSDFANNEAAQPWIDQPRWPCSWVRLPGDLPKPLVIGYRLRFHLAAARRFRVHVSGDERYEFFVDGARAGRGPARAARGRCHYETYELELPTGDHTFTGRVHSLGRLAPWAQTGYGHGWLLAPEPPDLWDVLGTGRAAWEAKALDGISFQEAGAQMKAALGCGPMLDVRGADFPWDWMHDADGWAAVETTYPGNNGQTLYFRESEPLLAPTPIPAMKAEPHFHAVVRALWNGKEGETFPAEFDMPPGAEEVQRWTGLLRGEAVTIAAWRKVRVLLDLKDYIAAFPALTTSGGAGAVVRVGWSEALVDGEARKTKRDDVAQRCWRGLTDSFLPDGGAKRCFDTLWWRCGRYVKLEIETGANPLRLDGLALEKTGYPLNIRAQWASGDTSRDELFGLCVRSLEACMHETYMDCPFYEQLQYLGDTRLQILLTYTLSGDDRLARQALTAFAVAQRNPSDWMPSNHPSGTGQRIPPFTLWWVSMLHDFGRWRGDREFVKALLPTARHVVGLWLENLRGNGLAAAPEGWNFVDWVDHLGNAGGEFHGVLNWHLAYTLKQLGELEEWCDEPELAARMQRLASSMAKACAQFWSAERGLYADDLDHTLFSEHANCLALLSGLMDEEHRSTLERTLFEAAGLARCTIYFSHYLFEVATILRRPDVLEKRLRPWLDLPARGFLTTPETFENARSDCHAWGAHPLYHYFASTLGIQPGGWGFESVEIAPQPGALSHVNGTMPHPRGMIEVELQQEGGQLLGYLTLPDGVGGVLRWGNHSVTIGPGRQDVAALLLRGR